VWGSIGSTKIFAGQSLHNDKWGGRHLHRPTNDTPSANDQQHGRHQCQWPLVAGAISRPDASQFAGGPLAGFVLTCGLSRRPCEVKPAPHYPVEAAPNAPAEEKSPCRLVKWPLDVAAQHAVCGAQQAVRHIASGIQQRQIGLKSQSRRERGLVTEAPSGLERKAMIQIMRTLLTFISR
jgi:hypothetical protein